MPLPAPVSAKNLSKILRFICGSVFPETSQVSARFSKVSELPAVASCRRLKSDWAGRADMAPQLVGRLLVCDRAFAAKQSFSALERIRLTCSVGFGAAKVSSLTLLERSPTPPPTSLDLFTQSSLQLSRMRPSRLWIKYPPLDAAVVDPGNPRRFLRSAEWKKVRDDFFHGQLAGCG